MYIKTILFNGTLPWGSYLSKIIQNDLNALYYLIGDLDRNGYDLYCYNEEGIIIKNRKDEPDSPSLRSDIGFLQDRVAQLEIQLDNIPEKEITKEVTQEFFLLFDMLPEHIKKELKIYVNKK